MAIPSRLQNERPGTFFVTTKIAEGRRLLQSERMATLLIEVLFEQRQLGRYQLHEFVVMPNHLHVLLTVEGTISKAIQVIKGRFAHDAREKFDIRLQIWQRGFSDHAIRDACDYFTHCQYIWQNPVKTGSAVAAEEFAYSSASRKYALDAPPFSTAAKAAQDF
jgi:putative transposase